MSMRATRSSCSAPARSVSVSSRLRRHGVLASWSPSRHSSGLNCSKTRRRCNRRPDRSTLSYRRSLELTEGRGANVVFEASGKPTAMASALEIAGNAARLVYIGIDVGGRAPAALGLIQSKSLQIRGIVGSPGVWPQTLRFLSRSQVDLSALVTSSFELANADAAIDTVLTDKSQVKVHITSSATL